MNSTLSIPMRVGIALLAALITFPAFEGWSMGSRVPAVGTPAEDFRLTDLEGKSQSSVTIAARWYW